MFVNQRGIHNIQDLDGLQYAISLTYLDFDTNQISDISPLAGLANLQNLYHR